MKDIWPLSLQRSCLQQSQQPIPIYPEGLHPPLEVLALCIYIKATLRNTKN